MSFVHLHNHSEYSFGVGSMPVAEMINRAAELGMSALAITDANGLFGAYEFHTQCTAAGIQPVLGLELQVSGIPGCAHNPSTLVLLAETLTGWRNLIRISSLACADGIPGAPIDLETVRAHAEGIICLSGGPGGVVSQLLGRGQYPKARRAAALLAEVFAPDCFFLELQHHGLVDELRATPELIRLGRELQLPLVATNECLYATSADADAYEVVQGIRGRAAGPRSDDRETSKQCFIKSPGQMASLFNGVPDALSNSVRIAQRCKVSLVDEKRPPAAELPDGFNSADEYLAKLCRDGLPARLAEVTPAHNEQLAGELAAIREQGHADYFLIVRDYVHQAHELGYLTWDRGSACGCLVNYALGITSVDPLAYGLSFERFLNPVRTWSCPDIDLDISGDGRSRLMRYMADKFGHDHVARIGSVYRCSAEQAGREIAEHLGLSANETSRLLYRFLANADAAPTCEAEALFCAAARTLADTPSHPGGHPCGLAVSASRIVDVVPLWRSDDDGLPIAQANTRWAEDVGLVKFDLITSETLTLFQDVRTLIATDTGAPLRIREIPVDDPDVFQMFKEGRTTGIFQFGAEQSRDRLCAAQPENIEQLAALLALCRPGPIFQFDHYVACRHGRREIRAIHPSFDAVVASTYGFIVFQEQIQQIARQVGGMDLGAADMLRRALGKSQNVEPHREAFIRGAQANGIDPTDAAAAFAAMVEVCRYTFNKAHAVTYALFAYTAAFLKHHYPAEFAAAYTNTHAARPVLCARVIADVAAAGVDVQRSDVNTSEARSTVVDGCLRLGLNTVQHCGEATVSAIIGERQASGPFTDLVALCQRVGPSWISRRTLCALIADGATSCLPGTPAQQFAIADQALAGARVGADPGATQAPLPMAIDSFDLVKELAVIHRLTVRDLSFDVYCPKTYSHHLRFTVWLPPDTIIFDVDAPDLVEQARSFVGGLEPEKKDDYVIGLNSRVDQYGDRHFLMLDLDSIDEAAMARLQEIGGYLLKSGIGYHFIGRELLANQDAWHARLGEMQSIPEFRGHLDEAHIQMSRKRGYSTLRLIESPTKPERPTMIKVL